MDEMHDTVMRTPEPEDLQLMIGVTDEIPVGKEQQLDDIPTQISRPVAWGSLFGGPRIRVRRGSREIYVSHIDISWVQCYKNIGDDEILSRFAGDNDGK